MTDFCDVRPTKNFDVIMKTKKSEAATMVLAPGEKTGGPHNHHAGSDQWMYVMAGKGEIIIDGKSLELCPERLVLIEANQNHEVRNTGNNDLKTLNFYAPSEY